LDPQTAQRLHVQIVSRRREVFMKFVVTGVAALCTAAVIGIHAQDKMGPDQMSKMGTHDQSYTGCVEAGKAPRTYVLTHVAATEDQMGKGEMAKDAMAKDAMGMKHDAMSPTTLVVSSKAVDLSKHVGHKVEVSGATIKTDTMAKDSMGMQAEAPGFTIKTLKTIGSSCQ
jgi:hypothetical protein